MDAKELEAKYGITSEWIEQSAESYEQDDFQHSDSPVYSGTHLDAVGTRRITVIYPASDVLDVQRIAKSRGVKPSEVYREALHRYVSDEKQALMA